MKNIAFFCILGLVFSPWCAAENPLKTYNDIIWASPKGFDLTLDIAAPVTEQKNLPVLVIFHGGGFLLNNKSIMSDLAQAVAKRTQVVTVNVNYRLLSDVNNSTKLNEIMEDGMGAVLWVKDHIAEYNGNPKQIAVTGDSAGGHIAAMVALAGRQLSSGGFSSTPLGFKPTYLPKGKTAELVAKEDGLKVQATLLSYAGFNLVDMVERDFETAKNPFWGWAHAEPRGMFGTALNLKTNPELYHAVSPNHYIVSSKEYKFAPQFIQVGDQDQITSAEKAKAYTEKMKSAGQNVKLTIYAGKGHGFLDSGCNDYTGGCFKELSEPAVTNMIQFLNEIFNIKQ